MKIKNLTQITRALVVRLALLILKHSSDGAVVKLFDTSLYITREKLIAQKQISSVKQAWLQGKPLARLVHRALHDLNLKASTYLVNNLVFNNSYGRSTKAREKFFQSEGFFPPYTLLISPTMRCNLKCVGCYASEYTRKDDLPPEVFNRVLSEARDLGIYFITVLGGEPFLREDLWDMCARYHDLYFNVFTNGTLITDASLKQLKRLGNVAVTVSLEGMQEVTDARRGQGVFARTMQAFDDLRSAGLLYGFSTMVTRQNIMEICSDAFVSMLVEKGCFFGWHFLYIPVGRAPDPALMPTAQQREYLRVNGARRIREKYPLFVIDFWNDAPYVGGCIAAGKDYVHVNANGDVEPCIFTHFAVDNVKEKSLREALTSPFFRGIRARQPFDKNLLLPCQLIDHPHIFREVFNEYHPRPTHPGADTLVSELAPFLDEYAKQERELMDAAWQKDFLDHGFEWKSLKGVRVNK